MFRPLWASHCTVPPKALLSFLQEPFLGGSESHPPPEVVKSCVEPWLVEKVGGMEFTKEASHTNWGWEGLTCIVKTSPKGNPDFNNNIFRISIWPLKVTILKEKIHI